MYIGNQPAQSFATVTSQTINGNGGATYTLNRAVNNGEELEVFVNNVQQQPTVAYTASSTTLTFTENVPSATGNIYVIYRGLAQNVGQDSNAPRLIGDNTLTGNQTITGDLTVDTNTLFVDASTNKVHINSTSADSDTSGLSCEFAGGNNYVAHFENTTNATPYTVAITEPSSASNGYPLLWVGSPSSGYLRVDSGTGVVTQAKKPIFMAKYSGFTATASRTNPATNSSSNYTTSINVGSHFNATTGKFTAPTAGTYIFFGSLLSGNANIPCRIYFEHNGNFSMDYQHEPRTTEGYSGYDKQMGHAIFTLNANDYVELTVYADSSHEFYHPNDRGYNSFSGYLLG